MKTTSHDCRNELEAIIHEHGTFNGLTTRGAVDAQDCLLRHAKAKNVRGRVLGIIKRTWNIDALRNAAARIDSL